MEDLNKVIIAGSRTFKDYALLKEKCDIILKNLDNIEIVSGTCRGADKLGEKYAKENNHKVIHFPANWLEHGKKAGYLRNKAMSEYADYLIAFHNGKSAGTKSMIELAKKEGLKVRVILFDEKDHERRINEILS